MFTKRQTRQRAVVAGLTALAVLLGAVALATEFFDTTLQTAVYDKAIDLSPAKVKNQVTIVALDDPTITQYGRYPLPRKAYADLIKALKPLSPAVVAFDVGFYDPAADPAEDRALAEAIRDFQTPTDPSQRTGSVILAMQGAGEQELGDHTTVYKTLQFPVPVLRDAASGLGAVNINPDPDGRVRDSQLVITGPDGARYYSLPLVAAARQQRADLAKLRREGDRLILPTPLGDRVMPVDRRGGMSVYYAAPPAPTTYDNPAYPCRNPAEFCVVSLKDVVNGAIDRRLIIGHAVLVGAHSVSAVPDDYPVPNSQGAKMYGVEIWANTAQSIFTNR